MSTEAAALHATPLDITQFIWLLLVATCVAMVGQRFRLPYALALVVAGLLIGAPHLLPQAQLDPHTLFTLFLPPLLFEASIQLRASALRQNGVAIGVLALAGTVISAVTVGALVHWLLGLPLAVALVFGALIAPTDPISVIAVLKRFGVSKQLALLVEGESLFNDGVAVVLFTVLLAVAAGGEVTPWQGLGRFGLVILGGAGVGVAVGAVASRVTREFDDHLLEIMLTTLVAFGAYLSAEAIHVSGVVAVVSAGLVVGNYGMQAGMSPTTRLAVHSFWEYAAFVANSVVFLLIGIEAAVTRWWEQPVLVAGGIGAALVGRAVAVYGLAPLINRLGGGVPLAWQHLMFWGGLRGALSMALALGLPADLPHREAIVAMTFGYVLFSLLVQGLTVSGLIRRLGLAQTQAGVETYQRLVGESLAWRAALGELQRVGATGLVAPGACADVAADFQARLEATMAGITALQGDDEALRAQQLAEARRLASAAAKEALLDAERAGVLPPAAAHGVVEALDAELAGQAGHAEG